jgi:hypothetical protein
VEAEVDSVGDTLSFGARGTLPLGPVEVRLKGSQRLFLDIGAAGRERHKELSPLATAFAAEVGRQFVSSKRHYGRMALEVSHFDPSGKNYLGILVHTGIRDTDALLWSLAFSVQARFFLPGAFSSLVLTGASERVLWSSAASKFRAGGELSFAQLMSASLGPTSTEHLVVTLGPSASWESGASELKARLGFRVWLDHGPAGANVSYLSEFDPPALTVSWTYRL